MIGALLSNTPASLLRQSGIAGDAASGPDSIVQDREPSAARTSLANAPSAAARSGNSPVLTQQAVLALQEIDEAGASGRRVLQVDSARAPAAEDDRESGASGTRETSGGSRGNADDASGDSSAARQDAAGTPQGATEAGEEKEDPDGDGLNEAEEKQVQELKQRDREVRAHEQAHARVGGSYAGPPSYTFQQGPDGKRYAVGGEVQIDTSPERTPEATIRKMRVVISAALAPAEPSGQDLSVAQQARSQLSDAQAELRQQKLEDLNGDKSENAGAGEAPDRAGSRSDPQSAPENQPDGSGAGAGNGNGPETGRQPAPGVRADDAALAANAYQDALQRAGAV